MHFQTTVNLTSYNDTRLSMALPIFFLFFSLLGTLRENLVHTTLLLDI